MCTHNSTHPYRHQHMSYSLKPCGFATGDYYVCLHTCALTVYMHIPFSLFFSHVMFYVKTSHDKNICVTV